MSKSEKNRSFMETLAAFIVDKRSLIFLIVIIGFIFSFFSRNWVEVENNLREFLPDDSETRQGLDVMEDEFITYPLPSARISVTVPARPDWKPPQAVNRVFPPLSQAVCAVPPTSAMFTITISRM